MHRVVKHSIGVTRCIDTYTDVSIDDTSGQVLLPVTDRASDKFVLMPKSEIIYMEEKSTHISSTAVVDNPRMEDKLITSAIDFISKLPQPILHHILGFLQAEDAARVAVLSKTWYQVWDTLPFLDFDESRNTKDLFPYVDSILSHRKNQGLSVHKFRFRSRSYEKFQSYLAPWIGTLRDLQVHDLCFHYHKSYYKPEDYGEFPEIILSVKSVTSLKLHGFHLDSFSGVDIIKWPSLRKLHLSTMRLNDDVIHNIVTNCYAIEDLIFEYCSGFNIITISSLVKLQNFVLSCMEECPKVEINILSLRSFYYMNTEMQDCFRINACTGLRSLKFTGDFITQEWFDKLFSLFPLLEDLDISRPKKLVRINISSCSLKRFSLSHGFNLVEANIDTPNLSTLIYHGNGAISFSLNAMPDLQVHLFLTTKIYDTLAKCSKVTTFLRKIGLFEVVKLSCFLESLYFPEEMKDELIYSQCYLKNLLLDFRLPFCMESQDTFTIHDATRLLDNILWIYSQLENLSIFAREPQLPALEVLFEMLSCREEVLDCCGSIPVKCWRHFLKEVNLEKTNEKYFEKVLKIKFRPRE